MSWLPPAIQVFLLEFSQNPILLSPLMIALGTLLSLYIGPILINAAVRYDIVDKPKPPLKVHKEPVPYLGGLVIFCSFLFTVSLTLPFDTNTLAILLASSMIVTVGLIDDLGALSPKDKLIGQMIAAFVLVRAGVKIDLTFVPSPVDEFISGFWLLVCINAVNLIDVSDGLATSVGIAGAGGALLIAIINHEPSIAAFAAALLGACLGFLKYNKQPAKQYLGDTGSMLIGLILGSLAMTGRYSGNNVIAPFFAPITVMAAPFFESTLLVIARVRAGKKVYLGSPDHIAIRLKYKGWSAKQVANTALVLGFVVCGLGAAATVVGKESAIMIAGFTVATALGMLGYVLMRLPAPPPKVPAPVPAPVSSLSNPEKPV